MGDGPGGGPSGAAPGTEGNIGMSPGTVGNLGLSATGADIGVTGSPSTTSATAINALLSAVPLVGPILAVSDFGGLAEGDPNPAFGEGVSGPDSGVGVGGGPGDFPARKPTAPPPQAKVPALLDEKPVGLPNILADIARRRFGRQQTILTRRGALSDTPTLKPTLLGQ